MWSASLIFLCVNLVAVISNNVSLFSERQELLRRELDLMLGSDLVLSDSEEKANQIIMELKHEELDHAFHSAQTFNLSKHFFEYKDGVRKTQLFKLIRKMPKGAILHIHGTGILNPDYVLELTYWPDLYICFTEDDLQFIFSKNLPNLGCESDWQLLKNVRYSSSNVVEFDAELRKHFTLVVNNPKVVHTDINSVWTMFEQYFSVTKPLLTYKPAWEQYFYDTLKAVRDDNVMYIEIRNVLPQLYDLDGNIYDSVATAETYKKVLDQFIVDYPDFFGAKLIYAPIRSVNIETLKEYIEIARKIKNNIPDFFAGFDLVGQEDLGAPLKKFLPVLSEAASYLDYFFHAGETNWCGMSTDENLVDAIVLGTRRIGHAFALNKHPLLLDEVKKRDIAIEVNIISNVVLKHVDDVRNHPIAGFLAQGLPIVLSSDAPGVWEADPLSHDFYVTFVGAANRHADLKLLKKLALNSLNYSTFADKNKLISEFEIRWTKFIDSVIKDMW